jgi:hypothetical protein
MTTGASTSFGGGSLPRAGVPAEAVAAAASRAAVGVVLAVAAVAGFLATGRHEAALAIHQAGPELTRLLRGMAAIKVLMAAGVSAVVLWRLGNAAAWPWLVGYAMAGAMMAAGPGLIWSMAHVTAGAIFLHGGLLATVLLLWRDPVTGQRLAAAVARRRTP